MKKLTACLCIHLGICAAISAADPLTQSMSPYADATLYVTNKNTMKNLDKAFQKKVEKDQKEAAHQLEIEGVDVDEDDDEENDPVSLLFSRISDRDAAAVFNLYVISWKGPKMVINGVANISGNLLSDMEDIRKKFPQLEKVQSDRRNDSFLFDSPDGLKYSIFASDRNTLHFQIDIRYDNPIPFAPLKAFRKKLEIPFDVKEPMFLFNCRPERIFRLLPPSMSVAPEFSNNLQQISDFFISGQIEGKNLKLNSVAECKDEKSAGELLERFNASFKKDFAADTYGLFFSNFNSRSSGSRILSDVDLELENAWDLLKKIPGVDFSGNEEP